MTAPTPEQLHANYVHALHRIARLGPEGEAERVGPLLCINAGIGVSKFNIAVVVDRVTDPRRALRDAMDWYAIRGLNPRLDLRGKADGPLLAASMLEGFQFWWREPVMVLHPLPEAFGTVPGLEVLEVRTPENQDLYCRADLEEYGDQEFQLAMVSMAAGMSGVSMHLGLRDGQPVARSMGVVHAGLVGVHNVYVPPSSRGRGYGAVLTAAAIDSGRAKGATAACLQATELGFPVYQKMGFRRVDDYVVVGRDEPPD
ncbi:MAG: GNAT family N-acetyltransferase [Dehalococcoidia bacterium]|nr:GNAT family N-acetyltransferase [Dehalococcoidia bacterium]